MVKNGLERSRIGPFYRTLDRVFEAAILVKQSRNRMVTGCFCFYLFFLTGARRVSAEVTKFP